MRKSINKTTVIIVLAVFLTLSVGYALFSDTVTIEGTATAQGNFDIEATCYTTIPENIINELDDETVESISVSYSDSGFFNETCTVVDDKVKFSVGLEYPGARKWYAVNFSNIGTIDGKVSTDSIYNMNEMLEIYDSSDTLISSSNNNSHKFFKFQTIMFKTPNGNFVNLDEAPQYDVTELLDKDNTSYLVKANGSLYVIFLAEWPENFSEDGVHYKATHTIDFSFVQHTD